MVGASPFRFICEVHREIYDFIEGNVTDSKEREKGFNLLAEAFWQGKRISDRLVALNPKDDVANFEKNLDFESDLYRRAERLKLLKNIRSVQIQTIDYCNRSCEWCPNSQIEKSIDTVMSWDVLNRVCRQLKDYNFTGSVHPFLMGEPLTDSRMPDIIQLIRWYLPKNHIQLITNGDNLKYITEVEKLLKSGCNSIHVNHYDDHKLNKVKDNIFPQVSHFGFKALAPTFYNRAGHVDIKPTKKVKRCDWFLKKFFFRHNGDMILCCSDYNYEVVFGNIMKNPLAAILNTPLYRKYYNAHKNGKAKELPLCKECNRI